MISIFEIIDGHLGETSESRDYKDLKEKKKGINNVQRLKKKTSQEFPVLIECQKSITLKKYIFYEYLNYRIRRYPVPL